MRVPVATPEAKAAATARYRQAERRFRRRALIERQANHPIGTQIALHFAHHVGVEAVRNARGDEPDSWERPPTIDPYDGGRNDR